MARAICTQCAKEVTWYAGRDCRLADLACPSCGGRLQSQTRGRQYGRCEHCGRRRSQDVLVTLPREAVIARARPRDPFKDYWDATQWDPVRQPAGAVVCGWHPLMVPSGERIAGCDGRFPATPHDLATGVPVEGYDEP